MSSIASRIKSIIVLNGFIHNFDSLRYFLKSDILLVAADGAAWNLKKQGIDPDIIIGDLDSLRATIDVGHNFPNTEIIEELDQETNDFEKALRLMVFRGLGPVLVAGMQGGDLEHSLNNWSVATKLCKEIEIWLLENDRIGASFVAGGFFNGINTKDKTISLIPQPEAVLTTQGLHWPLKEEKLALGYREGARNKIIESSFSVNVNSGSCLVFCGLDTEIVEIEYKARA